MNQTIELKNKALVLEAFDTLFNKRDYAAAERYWSPNYIQHSAHIEPGRDGLFKLIKSIPPALKYEPGTIVADKDFVIVHGIFGLRPAGELDCGGHCSYQGWRSRRALGCDRRLGHTRTIKERSANVWQQVRDLREWPIKKQIPRIVLEEVEPHESRHWQSPNLSPYHDPAVSPRFPENDHR
jgi:SnoaL-like domain